MRRILPNFFVVGAAKSGTTSLYRYLEQHPDVYMSSIKEPHWFSRVSPNPGRGIHPVTSEAGYLRLFKEWRGERAVGEASPSYLWDAAAPGRIEQSAPNARIIIVLREPISRAFSHYLMDVHAGRQDLPFYEALEEDYARTAKGWGISNLYVDLGLYCGQVSNYIETFGRENVLVLVFEEAFADLDSTSETVERVLSFLEVDPAVVDDIGYRRQYNPLVAPRSRLSRFLLGRRGLQRLGRRLMPGEWRWFLRDKVLSRRVEKPRLEPQAVEFLRRIYAPEIACLERLLGYKLPWKFPPEA